MQHLDEPVQEVAGRSGSRSSSATRGSMGSVPDAARVAAGSDDDDDAEPSQQQKRMSGCSSTLYGSEGSAKDLDGIRESSSSVSLHGMEVLLVAREPIDLRRHGVAAAGPHHAKEDETVESLELGEISALKEMKLQFHEAQVAVVKDLLVQRGQLSKESARLKRKLRVSQQRGELVEHHKQAMRRNERTMRSLSALLWKLKGKLCLAPDQAEAEAVAAAEGEGLSEELEKLLATSLGVGQKFAEEPGHLRPKMADVESDRSRPTLDVAGFKLAPRERGGAVAGVAGAADFDELGVIRMIIAENVASRRQSEALQDVLASQRKVVQAQFEQIAKMQGSYESKIKRLTEQLESSKKEHAETQEELEALRNSTEAWSSEGLRERLELLETQVSNGMACPSGQPLADECEYPADWSDDEGDDLSSRLRRVEHDRNVLLNTLEWKEVQWKARFENMERDAMHMQRRHSEATRCASEPAQPLAQQPARPTGSRLSSMLGLLRPFGLARSLSISTTTLAAAAGPEPAFCQDACWQVLNAVSGAVVFRCSVNSDFTILESSQEAGRIWGSAALEGNSVLSLASARSATWLRLAFKSQEGAAAAAEAEPTPQVDAPSGQLSGFMLRDLGRETFVDKRDQSFDCTVKAIRFPAEAACGKEPVFLVILELEPEAPSESASQRFSVIGSPSDGARSRRHSPGLSLSARSRSARSTSSTSSVTPSDSASNIIMVEAAKAPPQH